LLQEVFTITLFSLLMNWFRVMVDDEAVANWTFF
jgi:hypothetical protein